MQAVLWQTKTVAHCVKPVAQDVGVPRGPSFRRLIVKSFGNIVNESSSVGQTSRVQMFVADVLKTLLPTTQKFVMTLGIAQIRQSSLLLHFSSICSRSLSRSAVAPKHARIVYGGEQGSSHSSTAIFSNSWPLGVIQAGFAHNFGNKETERDLTWEVVGCSSSNFMKH